MSKTVPTPSDVGSPAPEGGLPDPMPGVPHGGEACSALEQVSPLFDAAFGPYAHVVLAVSGGSDSMALMVLSAAWRQRALCSHRADASRPEPPSVSVVTIDHGLRPGSAAEAAAVAREAGNLGLLPHTTLRWPGPKPATGLQAAARAARRDLIRTHLEANRWSAVAMAHTADDQAETVLMRLARGSGIDGLAAMRPSAPLGPRCAVLRPLLGVTKAELQAFLRARSIVWFEDPSNAQPVFERVRLRTFQGLARGAGVSLDSSALARTATRAARASAALQTLTHRAWRAAGPRALVDRRGIATLDWGWLLEQPDDVRFRLLAGLIEAIGGQRGAVSLGALEAMVAVAGWQRPPCGTLHGAKLAATGTRGSDHPALMIMREWGRLPRRSCVIVPGQTLIWDHRFEITLAATCPVPLQCGPLGELGIADLDRLGGVGACRAHETSGALSQPALRDGGDLVCVPGLGWARSQFSGLVGCKPLEPNFGAEIFGSEISGAEASTIDGLSSHWQKG